ncbi:MAG: hypothetical protein LBV23_09010 [Deltaproteobacteria bacterium]|nr:hypothetical protein [Deltaproteobacteria bacterium]
MVFNLNNQVADFTSLTMSQGPYNPLYFRERYLPIDLSLDRSYYILELNDFFARF